MRHSVWKSSGRFIVAVRAIEPIKRKRREKWRVGGRLLFSPPGRIRQIVMRIAICLTLPVGSGCASHSTPGQADAKRGKEWITRMSCGSCHEIPGIEGADGMVGPPLRHFGSQQLIAGALPNTPDNLRRYLRSPQTVVPGNEMPPQQLTIQQRHDIAAYLLRLR